MSTTLDPTSLRRALGAYPTGVTIVTAMTGRGPLGMTVNSFASVSLDPPLVLWSPARKSARFEAFEKAAFFAVNVLAEDQSPLADAFAKEGLEPFERVPFASGLGDIPLLEGTAASFECRQAAGYDGGDHLIIVGQVERFARHDKQPLVFCNGTFSGL